MALVFPRVKPVGTTTNGSRSAVSSDMSFPTKAMVYLKIDVYDSKSNNPYSYVGGGTPGRTSSGTAKETIYLYLPAGLVETYTTRYNQVAVGGGGMAVMKGVKDGTSDIGNTISSAAEQLKSQLAGQVAASGANLANMGQTNLSFNDITALTAKAILNPYEETTFQGTDYRKHSFNFRLAPRSPEDVVAITKIVQTLRVSMLPGKNGSSGGSGALFTAIDSGAGRGDRWLTIPDFFQLSIVRYKNNGNEVSDNMSKPETLSFMMKFPTKCVLTNMSVNMTPDGQLNTIRNGATGDNDEYDYGPSAYELTLQFDETAFLTRDMLTDQ